MDAERRRLRVQAHDGAAGKEQAVDRVVAGGPLVPGVVAVLRAMSCRLVRMGRQHAGCDIRGGASEQEPDHGESRDISQQSAHPR